MRMLLLVDNKITEAEVKEVTDQFTALLKQYTDITPTYFIKRKVFTQVPTEADSDGDLKPSPYWLKGLTDSVHLEYGTYGVDSIVMWVHRDNWNFKGIWGTNWSNVYHQYHLHLCRFDDKNTANSLGTLYHEWMHSLDALIKTHTGVEIDNFFKQTQCFANWDSTCVHGNRFQGCKETPYQYIRWKENTDALAKIAPDLRKAYQVRKELYLEPYRQVQLRVISWLRALLNRKDGIKVK